MLIYMRVGIHRIVLNVHVVLNTLKERMDVDIEYLSKMRIIIWVACTNLVLVLPVL